MFGLSWISLGDRIQHSGLSWGSGSCFAAMQSHENPAVDSRHLLRIATAPRELLHFQLDLSQKCF